MWVIERIKPTFNSAILMFFFKSKTKSKQYTLNLVTMKHSDTCKIGQGVEAVQARASYLLEKTPGLQ